MLQITNPSLKLMLLQQIVERIDDGGLDDLLQAGFGAELLDMLRHRPARDLIKLSEYSGLGFQVSLDQSAIVGFLERLDAIRRDAAMREYFIRNGAPVRLVCDFFRMSAEEVRTLRSQLLAPEENGTRNRMPPPDTRDRVHRRWHEISQEMPDAPTRERMYELHQAFADVRIDALCRALNEFADEPKWAVTDFGPIQ